jgi:spore coat polysaccharide biosynthesis protein SpsF
MSRPLLRAGDYEIRSHGGASSGCANLHGGECPRIKVRGQPRTHSQLIILIDMHTGVVAIIQARIASSRLPGKVLMDIGGTAMLGHVVRRTRGASKLARVILATSTEAADDAIEDYCRRHDIECFRGSHFDVLDRYYSAARRVGADAVVRITADCPLIDPGLIDETVQHLSAAKGGGYDFVATRLPPPWTRTFPIGLDVEACTMQALERAWVEAREPGEREHVMPYLYKAVRLATATTGLRTGTSSSGMRIAVLDCVENLGLQRWTVDTPEDLEFVREVYAAFGGQTDFTWMDVRDMLRSRPEIMRINSGVRHKDVGEIDTRAQEGDAS